MFTPGNPQPAICDLAVLTGCGLDVDTDSGHIVFCTDRMTEADFNTLRQLVKENLRNL